MLIVVIFLELVLVGGCGVHAYEYKYPIL